MGTAHLCPSVDVQLQPSPAADPSPALCSPLAPALRSAASLTFCQPEDNAELLTSRENREKSFPSRAEAEHSPSCCRCCLIWGPRSCSVLAGMGPTLKLCDVLLACSKPIFSRFFPSWEFLGIFQASLISPCMKLQCLLCKRGKCPSLSNA